MIVGEQTRARLLEVCQKAGQEAMAHYEENLAIEAKEDKTPVTSADMASHRVLCQNLTSFPVVSEENSVRLLEGPHWLVDPLDGTKEFIKGNGEFTVNVALMQNGNPVLGLVYIPASGVAYYSGPNGAFKFDGDWSPIRVREPTERLCLVVSRSHAGTHVDRYIATLRKSGIEVETRVFGSALKMCKVAEGDADLYPRFTGTMPWDTAAGQALVKAAGGVRGQIDRASSLVYAALL